MADYAPKRGVSIRTLIVSLVTLLMRLLIALLLCVMTSVSAVAQVFVDRSDLLDEQNENKHFSWSASIADLDGNGLPDIHEPGILYLQQQDGSFVSSLPELGITYRPLPPPITGYEGRGVFGSVMADMDDDGFNELVILDIINDSSKVFHNAYGLRLTEVSPGNGIDFRGLGQGAAFADYNGDGILDLFFGEEQGSNQLFLGTGQGSFTETTSLANIDSNVQTYGVATADYDNDGDMDVFIAACAQDAARSINLLFQNQGDGTFIEVGAAAGINDNGNAWGVNFLDYDRDGWLDIHVANMRISFLDLRGNANKLYRNRGDGTFEDVSEAAGIEGNDDSYGSSVADFNNDGWPDIWAANFGSPPTIMMNNGDGTFTDFFTSSGLTDIFRNLSVAVGDINGDGWIDAYSGSDDPSGPLSRLLFNTPAANNWLNVRLIQEAPNRRAIGSRLTLWIDGERQLRDIVAGDGFVSQNLDLSAHFGLGSSTAIDSLVVKWPDGHIDRWTSLDVNQQLHLQKGGSINHPPRPFEATSIASQFTGSELAADVVWQTSEDPEGQPINYTVAVRDSSGTIVHVSEPLQQTSYSFSVDTTGVALSGPMSFAVSATDGMHIIRSVNTATTVLQGTDLETTGMLPARLALRSAWPQPANNRIHFEVDSPMWASGEWTLYNVQGREIARQSIELRQGTQVVTIETGAVSPGLYLVRFTAGSRDASRTVVVTR